MKRTLNAIRRSATEVCAIAVLLLLLLAVRPWVVGAQDISISSASTTATGACAGGGVGTADICIVTNCTRNSCTEVSAGGFQGEIVLDRARVAVGGIVYATLTPPEGEDVTIPSVWSMNVTCDVTRGEETTSETFAASGTSPVEPAFTWKVDSTEVGSGLTVAISTAGYAPGTYALVCEATGTIEEIWYHGAQVDCVSCQAETFTTTFEVVDVTVVSITPAGGGTVCPGDTAVLHIETDPPGNYDVVDVNPVGVSFRTAYDPATGDVEVLFDQGSEAFDDRGIDATAGGQTPPVTYRATVPTAYSLAGVETGGIVTVAATGGGDGDVDIVAMQGTAPAPSSTPPTPAPVFIPTGKGYNIVTVNATPAGATLTCKNWTRVHTTFDGSAPLPLDTKHVVEEDDPDGYYEFACANGNQFPPATLTVVKGVPAHGVSILIPFRGPGLPLSIPLGVERQAIVVFSQDFYQPIHFTVEDDGDLPGTAEVTGGSPLMDSGVITIKGGQSKSVSVTVA